jgi:hypothetical protein
MSISVAHPWSGIASDLLRALDDYRPDQGRRPKTPKTLAGARRRLAPRSAPSNSRSRYTAAMAPNVGQKKMKCRICGEYNDVGTAQPYKGPSSKRLGKKYGTIVNVFGAQGT